MSIVIRVLALTSGAMVLLVAGRIVLINELNWRPAMHRADEAFARGDRDGGVLALSDATSASEAICRPFLGVRVTFPQCFARQQ